MKFKARKFDYENAKWKCVWNVPEKEFEKHKRALDAVHYAYKEFCKSHNSIICHHCNNPIMPGSDIVSAFEQDYGEGGCFYCSYRCFVKDYGGKRVSYGDGNNELYNNTFPIFPIKED